MPEFYDAVGYGALPADNYIDVVVGTQSSPSSHRSDGFHIWQHLQHGFVQLNDGLVLFHIITLIILIVTERLTFKLMVDQLAPFRFILMQLALLLNVLFTALVLANRMYKGQLPQESDILPKTTLFQIALLDSIQMNLLFVPASKIDPFLTIILLQGVVPLTLLMSCREHTMGQILGAVTVSISIIFALIPSIISVIRDDKSTSDLQEWFCAILFLSSSVPAAWSQLLKEKFVQRHRQPIDPQYLNFVLSIYQLLIVVITFPLTYHFQELGFGWNQYPTNLVWRAFVGGWECSFLGRMPETTNSQFLNMLETANCEDFTVLKLILPYVIASICTGLIIEKLIFQDDDSRIGLRVVYHTMTVGIACSSSALILYSWIWWRPISYANYIEILMFSMSFIFMLVGLVLYRSVDSAEDDLITSHRCPSQARILHESESDGSINS